MKSDSPVGGKHVTLALRIFRILMLKSIHFLKLMSIDFLMLAVAKGIKHVVTAALFRLSSHNFPKRCWKY